jgi:hypothetical protein
MRYIKGTLRYGILFPGNAKETNMNLVAYSGVNWYGDKQDRKEKEKKYFWILAYVP